MSPPDVRDESTGLFGTLDVPVRRFFPATIIAVPLTAYLDAFSGLSGDMLVGALADAGADPAAIADAIASLQINATVMFDKVKRGGISATKFRVHAEDTKKHRHLSHIE